MDAHHAAGLAGLYTQADTVGRVVLLLMLLMSLASWTTILAGAARVLQHRRRDAGLQAALQALPDPQALQEWLSAPARSEAGRQLAQRTLAAQRACAPAPVSGPGAEALAQSLRRVLEEQSIRLESGLTVLASVGSTAPFVGLFGTVWGVYHALVAIGRAGQGSLDQVAGPVGEALVMTALGLAVAIPAVLAYNALLRANRHALARLDACALELHAWACGTPGLARS